jgi:hypothetical protein
MKNRPSYKLKHIVAAYGYVLCFGMAYSKPSICLFIPERIGKAGIKICPVDSPVDNEESNPLANSTEEKAPSFNCIGRMASSYR